MSITYKIKKAHRESELNRQRRLALGIVIAIMLIAWSVHSGIFTATSTEAAYGDAVYVRVERGDSLWSIANEYKPSSKDIRDFVRTIATFNGIDDNYIYEGQILCVPQ